MSKQFLNERLVASKRFSPGEHPSAQADAGAGAKPDAPVPVDELRRREERAHRESALDENRAELRRRRAEVIEELESALDLAERRRTELDKAVKVYGEKLESIRSLPEDGPELLQPAMQRKLREELHTAHIEMQIRRRGEGSREARPAAWQDMSFGDMTRIGLALAWPVVAALLIAGGAIAWVLYTVFNVG